MFGNILYKTVLLVPVAGIIMTTDLFPLPYWFGYLPAGDMVITHGSSIMHIPLASTFLVVTLISVAIHWLGTMVR